MQDSAISCHGDPCTRKVCLLQSEWLWMPLAQGSMRSWPKEQMACNPSLTFFLEVAVAAISGRQTYQNCTTSSTSALQPILTASSSTTSLWILTLTPIPMFWSEHGTGLRQLETRVQLPWHKLWIMLKKNILRQLMLSNPTCM